MASYNKLLSKGPTQCLVPNSIIEGLFTPQTWVVPRPNKICGWLLNSSWDHFGLHQGKNVGVTMEFKIPKRHITRPDHPLTWSNGFCNGRGKRGVVVENSRGPWQRNVVMINLCWGREYQDKRRQENGQTWFFFFLFESTLFGHILKNK